MTESLIKVDLNQSPYDNENIHNRWHPDIPMVSWVKPGDDFVLETYDWTGGSGNWSTGFAGQHERAAYTEAAALMRCCDFEAVL